jgi:hypothetical protein
MYQPRWRAVACLIMVSAAMTFIAACGEQTIVLKPTATAIPTVTPTPIPSCPTLLPGSVAATPITGFTEVQFPSGTVDTAPHQTYGGTGQFTIIEYDLCYTGTPDDLIGPFSGHHSVTANLLGAGWGTSQTFPYTGDIQQPCVEHCFDFADNQRYLTLDQITDHGNSVITYRMRLAAPPLSPTCNPTNYPAATPYSIYFDPNTTSAYHFQLPPLSKISSFNGGGHAGGTDTPICSAGTYATMIAFMQSSVTAAGWTVGTTSGTGFTAQMSQNGQTLTIDMSTSNGLISTTSEWVLTVHAPM